MSKGVKIAIGIVAAIAIPFVAPMIATAIGGSTLLAGSALSSFFGGAGGSALVGAGLGAASSAATGQNPLLGAALGGVGGFAGGGGFSGLFGTGANTAGAAGTGAAGTGAAGATTAGGLGTIAPAGAATSLPTMAAAPPTFAGAGLSGTGAGLAGAAAAPASAATGFSLSSLGNSLASAVNPSNLAQLAAVMYNTSNYNQLDANRQALVREAADLAATNRGLFEQRVNAARSMMQSAQANPQQAFATTEMAVQRRLRDATGAEPGAERKAAIEGTRLGILAAEREQERARGAMSSAAAMIPTQAPAGSARTNYDVMAADINARGQLATQGANLVTRMFPNELDRERERNTRNAGLFRTP
jgi:hypothetical protein